MQELTQKEKQVYDLYQSGKGTSEIARIFQQDDRTIRRYAQHIKEKGYILRPENVSDKIGYVSGKITSQQIQNKDGEWVETQRWIRESPQQLAIEDFITLVENKVVCKFPEIKSAKVRNNRAIVLPIGDPHLGMMAWGPETGEDYDLKIGRDLHFKNIIEHIDTYAGSEVIYICPLGDLFHIDSRSNTTEKSGHVLDTDTRFDKIVEVVEDLLIDIITYAGQKYGKVVFSAVRGNHDWHSSMWVSRILKQAFSKSKHIEIDIRPQKQRYFEYGSNLFGITHGDTERNVKNLAQIMSHDMREAWGRTIHHYWYTGHIHQQKIFEFPSCVVESFNTLAPKDSYAAEYAYRSRRKLTSIVLDREAGEVERKTTVVV